VLSEIVAIRHPARLDRVVFASGDCLATFPPRWARLRFAVAYIPPLSPTVGWLLGPRALRRLAYRRFAWRVDQSLVDSFTRGVRTDRAIRHDTMKLWRAVVRGRTGAAHEELRAFDRPALVIWGADDQAFPQSHADVLAEALTDVQVERVAGSKTFLGQDQPHAFARAVAGFLGSAAS
jgi:pimeloyl-ACP methyl ester carboxylesterase